MKRIEQTRIKAQKILDFKNEQDQFLRQHHFNKEKRMRRAMKQVREVRELENQVRVKV